MRRAPAKRSLLVAALAGAALVLPLSPYPAAQRAAAAVVVEDPGNLVAQAKNLLQEVKGYALELQKYANMVQQLAWAETQAQALIQHPSLGQAEALMGIAGIHDPTGLNLGELQYVVTGFGNGGNLQSLISRVNGLGSIINSTATVNNVYNCTTQDFACQAQQQAARANAGYQGVIGTIYNQFQAHLPVTEALRTNLAGSTDPAQRENVMAQLAAEQVWAQTASAQLTTATALYQAQRDMNVERGNQQITRDIDALVAAAPKAGG